MQKSALPTGAQKQLPANDTLKCSMYELAGTIAVRQITNLSKYGRVVTGFGTPPVSKKSTAAAPKGVGPGIKQPASGVTVQVYVQHAVYVFTYTFDPHWPNR